MARLYIERHLVDEKWRDEQLEAGTHLIDPDDVLEKYPTEAAARARLDQIASESGCELTDMSDAPGHDDDCSDGVFYFSFDRPEDEETEGYASLYLGGSAAAGGYTPSD